MTMAGKKKPKYRNKKIVADGITFDSQKEYHRYSELKLLEKAGKITDLRLQVPFELIPPQYEYYKRYGKTGKPLKDGKKAIEHAVKYVADFVYIDTENKRIIVEDTKGVKTKDYIIKRKLMLYVHGIRIREV